MGLIELLGYKHGLPFRKKDEQFQRQSVGMEVEPRDTGLGPGANKATTMGPKDRASSHRESSLKPNGICPAGLRVAW